MSHVLILSQCLLKNSTFGSSATQLLYKNVAGCSQAAAQQLIQLLIQLHDG